MKNYRLWLIIYLIFLQNSILFAQLSDTSKHNSILNDSIKLSFNHNKINKINLLSNLSDTINSNFFVWNDKRNLQEILNEIPGYYSYFFGTGGKSLINYNGLSNTGVFRNGIESNDLFNGRFDVENISVNEIEKIENVSAPMSFLYGLNSYGKIINIIDKDNFQPNLFTQFRYSQDRDGALFADVFMNFPISRKFNFIIGINNYGSEGHYTNSDFSIWRSRFQFNFYPSDKFNIKFFYSANNTQRGLNDGLIFNTSKDTLIDPNLASVVNSDAYEKIFYTFSDLKITGKLFKDSLSLTNLNLFTNNSKREYRDEENRPNSNGIMVKKDYHSIQYGFDLNQTIFLIPFKLSYIKLLSGLKGYYNLYDFDRSSVYKTDSIIGVRSYNFNALDLYSRMDLSYNKFLVSCGIKTQRFNNSYHFMYGTELEYNIFFSERLKIILRGGLSNTTFGFDYESLQYDEYFDRFINNYDAARKKYYETGFTLNADDFSFSLMNYHSNSFNSYSILNTNISFGIDSKNYSIIINLNSFDKNNYNTTIIPPFYLSSDIAYKDILFKRKLILKTGFNIKYISEKPNAGFDQFSNRIIINNNISGFDYINLDYYIGARIGKANINITLANLLNNLVYNSSLYPFDNRGGLLRSISRFTITWDFWN